MLNFYLDIYKLLVKGQTPLCRPTLPEPDDDDGCNEELSNLIKRCWAEEPGDRPDFHALKNIIKRMNK